MPTQVLTQPEPAEYSPHYNPYIAAVPGQDALAILVTQLGALDPLQSLGEKDALHRYAPGKWSVKEVIGHINDSERVFSYRMMRIARGDKTPLAGFDQDDFILAANFDSMPVARLVDAFRATRAATISLASEITGDAWLSTGVASDAPVSARALAYLITGHAAHHINLLRDKYGLTALR